MSLSIDYFTMPPKSQEVSQIQSAEQTKLHQENQEFAAQFQHQVEQNSQTTIRRREVENDELKNDDQSRISFLQSFEKDSVIVKCIGHPISEDRFKKINSTYRVR